MLEVMETFIGSQIFRTFAVNTKCEVSFEYFTIQNKV